MSPAVAQEKLKPNIISDLKRDTKQLAELMRQNVEFVYVDTDHIVSVKITTAASNNKFYPYDGAIVPFDLEGVDGGSFVQQYVALFMLVKPSEQALALTGSSGDPNRHVSLLAFAQIDNRGPVYPDWSRVHVNPGHVTVPLTIHPCHRPAGMMILNVNNNAFGQKINITFDAAAIHGPGLCP